MTLRYRVHDPGDLRVALIDAGVIRPGVGDGLKPLRLPSGTRVLRLDHAGKRAAVRHVAEGPMVRTPDDQHPLYRVP